MTLMMGYEREQDQPSSLAPAMLHQDHSGLSDACDLILRENTCIVLMIIGREQ